jgi:hypothetical protein
MTQAAFQSVVNEFSGFGVPGTRWNQAPWVSSANTIYSESNSANNIFGYACSYSAPNAPGQNIVNPGNTGGQVYAGIIANPESTTLFGGSSGPLSPTLVIPNNTVISVVSEGFVVVKLNNAANIGDVVIFENATGALYSQAPETALPSGYSNANATVAEFSLAAAGLAVIWINPGAPKLQTALTIVPETEITWSGGGATLIITVAGVEVGDLVMATINTPSTESASLEGAVVTAANTIEFTLSAANTANNATIVYSVVRG